MRVPLLHSLGKKLLFLLCAITCLGLTETAAQTFQQGDVFVAVGSGRVQWRRANGTLVQTLNTGLGGFTTGMAFDASGKLYVTNFTANSVSVFNTNGTLQGTFGSGYSTPESIVFDQAGNVYVGNLGNGIRKFSSTGTFIGTVAPGRIDFFDLAADQCTALFTTESSFIGRHNLCTNTALSNFASGLGGNAYALRIRQNGEVLLGNGVNIRRLSAAGAPLQTYDVGGENSWFALNLNPDGTSFWSADFGTANVYKIDIATGNVLANFNTGTGGNTVFGLAVFGEFTVSVCADNVLPAFVSPSPTCGSTLSATVGVPFSFTVSASDANAGDAVTLNASGIPAGATLTPSVPVNGNPVSTTFNWTPTATGTVNISFTAQDKCGITTCNYTINVGSGGSIYYSKAAGDLHDVLTWGLNPDGSGANPTDFNDSTFQLANRGSGLYTMTANWTVNGGTVNIPSGSQLQINGFTFSISELAGAGTVSGSPTSNLAVIGTNGGNIGLSFTAGSNMLNNLSINRAGAGAAATLGNALDLLNVLTLTTGTLNTGGWLTLKSSAANTARVAPVTGTISGDVKVERYIPARRAWRILSAPVGGTQTVQAGWQEGSILGQSVNPNPFPGYGTHITGGPVLGTIANGFDQNPVAVTNEVRSSLKRYNSVTNGWVEVPTTNVTTINAEAFMVFVRGDRGIPLSYRDVPPTPTTLRSTGPLKVGDQNFVVNPTGFTAIPNPYASPIDFATLTRNGVQNNFYLWDPKMGGVNGAGAYVLLSDDGAGGYTIVPAPVSPESQYIQSGQGFLVRPTTAGVAGSLTIKESDKSATPATDVFRIANGRQPAQRQESLRITLKAASQLGGADEVLDEALTVYSSRYSNKLDALDAVKAPNINENLGIETGGEVYMIERKEIINEGDVVQLKAWNLEQKTYLLQIEAANLSVGTLKATLEDRYLKTETPIDLANTVAVSFTVTSDPASAQAHRFRVVIGLKNKVVKEEKRYLSAYPNPLAGSSVNVVLGNQEKGRYVISIVNNAGQVVFQRTIQHRGGSATEVLQFGKKPVAGTYQIRISGREGTLTTPLVIN